MRPTWAKRRCCAPPTPIRGSPAGIRSALPNENRHSHGRLWRPPAPPYLVETQTLGNRRRQAGARPRLGDLLDPAAHRRGRLHRRLPGRAGGGVRWPQLSPSESRVRRTDRVEGTITCPLASPPRPARPDLDLLRGYIDRGRPLRPRRDE